VGLVTPGERVVLAAAEHWAESIRPDTGLGLELLDAVNALHAERAGKTPAELVELELTYGQVVEGDEVHSAKLDKWFAVSASVRTSQGMQRVTMPATGNVKVKPPRPAWHLFPADKPCRVRRGAAGQAVNLFATVLWSGPSMVPPVDTDGGPTFADHDVATDPEASESED
jgi:hypothetical protein